MGELANRTRTLAAVWSGGIRSNHLFGICQPCHGVSPLRDAGRLRRRLRSGRHNLSPGLRIGPSSTSRASRTVRSGSWRRPARSRRVVAPRHPPPPRYPPLRRPPPLASRSSPATRLGHRPDEEAPATRKGRGRDRDEVERSVALRERGVLPIPLDLAANDLRRMTRVATDRRRAASCRRSRDRGGIGFARREQPRVEE